MVANNVLKKVPIFLGYSTKEETQLSNDDLVSVEERRQIFKINEAYYHNNVYDRVLDGGALDYINDFLGEAKANDLKGTFNPIKRVVEVYAQTVFNGRFGKDIVIDDVKDETNQPIHKNLKSYVSQIAKWSNFDQELKNYTRLGSLQGTVGIRIVSKVGADFPKDDPKKRRVYLQFEHPATILDAVRDKRGNVRSIITEYIINQGELTLETLTTQGVKRVLIKELMTKEFIEKRSQQKGGILSIIPFFFGGKEQNRIKNVLGVVPYVLVQHEKKAGLFGAWAFQGVERKIDMVNALSSHLDRQIIRHVKAVWMASSQGSPPTQMKFAGNEVIWFELDEGATPPSFEAMVAQLSLSETIEKIKLNLQEIGDSLPELKATDGEYLSGQSGETVAQLRLPAEQRILSARTTYEDGLIRAIQIALSWGILLGIFDFDTGLGTREAADEAYNTGALNFRFKERDALPITKAERLDLREKELAVEETEALLGIVNTKEETTKEEAAPSLETSSKQLGEGDIEAGDIANSSIEDENV